MTLRPRVATAAIATTTAVFTALLVPELASAATPHGGLVAPSASIFTSIGSTLLGAFSWTFTLAEKFLLTTLGALVRLLVPRSWIHEGLQIMAWIVAVPNYAGQITTPGGGRYYGFAGINDLRELFMWLGLAIVPLTLTHAAARSLVDDTEPVAIPVLRVIGTAGVILLYPWLWTQAADLADQVTHLILGLPAVTDGIQKLMVYAVDGVALGGWQLIDLGLMGAIGTALLGLIFMKVVLIIVGAILYATGPVMIGLVATQFGHAIARAWVTAVIFLLGVGILWATILAVGALLINDADSAGPLIGGQSAFGALVGGLILAIAGLVALWLCLRVAREAGGLLRLQLGGILALGAGRGLSRDASHASSRASTTGASLRQYGARVAAGARAAGGELADAAPGGRAMRGAMTVGRRGLIGSAAVGTLGVARRAGAPTAAILNGRRAGAVAVQMARSGSAAYQSHPSSPTGRRPTVNTSGPGARTGRADARHRSGTATTAPATTSRSPSGRSPGRAQGARGIPSSPLRTPAPSPSSVTERTPIGAAPNGVTRGTDRRQETGARRPSRPASSPRSDTPPASPWTGDGSRTRTTTTCQPGRSSDRASTAPPRRPRTAPLAPPVRDGNAPPRRGEPSSPSSDEDGER